MKDPRATAERESASAKVYGELRSAIMDREFLPGEALSRPDLAQRYGTSPTPVREALLHLERDGLVRVRPQAGTVVAPISILDVHQAHFLRLALELDVVKRLATRPERRDLSDIRAATENDHLEGSFAARDEVFHLALFEAVGMTALRRRIQPILTPLDRYLALDSLNPSDIRRASDEHVDILERIEAADVSAACQAMSGHLAGLLQNFGRHQRDHPELFELAED
ncbi:MAG: GntR family transcriptional regulator [Pseudomonadota bacterium]